MIFAHYLFRWFCFYLNNLNGSKHLKMRMNWRKKIKNSLACSRSRSCRDPEST